MKKLPLVRAVAVFRACALFASPSAAQVGRRFPSEKKIVIDPVTGTPRSFLSGAPV
jgi:oligogalacturonide lyase